jgi:hypothetical protein
VRATLIGGPLDGTSIDVPEPLPNVIEVAAPGFGTEGFDEGPRELHRYFLMHSGSATAYLIDSMIQSMLNGLAASLNLAYQALSEPAAGTSPPLDQ